MMNPAVEPFRQVPTLGWIIVIALLALGFLAFAFGIRVRVGKR